MNSSAWYPCNGMYGYLRTLLLVVELFTHAVIVWLCRKHCSDSSAIACIDLERMVETLRVSRADVWGYRNDLDDHACPIFAS